MTRRSPGANQQTPSCDDAPAARSRSLTRIARRSPRPRRFTATCTALFALVTCAGLVGGCRSQDPNAASSSSSPPAPAPSAEHAAEIRQQLLQENPNALVGDVVEVLPEANLAAVGNLDVARLQVGQVLVFVDREKQPIGAGEIVRIVDNQVHVRYEPVQGKRGPQTGDVAVR